MTKKKYQKMPNGDNYDHLPIPNWVGIGVISFLAMMAILGLALFLWFITK